MVGQGLVRAQVYADEHARAAVLQAAVLPSEPADVADLDVAVTYQPADGEHGLGGDWYDVMALPKQRAYLAVGDVVGHGLPAVEDMLSPRMPATDGSPLWPWPCSIRRPVRSRTLSPVIRLRCCVARATGPDNTGAARRCESGRSRVLSVQMFTESRPDARRVDCGIDAAWLDAVEQ
jgi:hypothetical protein